MSASIQTSFNFTPPVEPSSAVSFFRGTPRWPGASRNFRLSWSYLRRNALTALFPIIVALILTFIFAIHLTIRYTCRQQAVDARILRFAASKRATIIQISLAALISTLATLFIALALSAITSLHFSAQDGLDLLDALITDISRAGFAVVDVALLIQRKVQAFNPATVVPNELNPTLGDMYAPTITAVVDYVKNAYPDMEPLHNSLVAMVNRIQDALRIIRKATDITFGVLVAIIILLLSAPLLLAFEDALPMSRRSRPCRIIAHILFLFLPGLLAWVLVGLTSAVGAGVADLCVTLHEFRAVVAGEISPADVPNNALVDADFMCTKTVDAQQIQERLTATIDALEQNRLADDALNTVLGTSAKSVADAARWTRDVIGPYVDCSRISEFSGKMELIVCASAGRSAVRSVLELWICLLGLAIIMTIALFASLTGARVAWSLLVWPRGKGKAEAEAQLAAEDEDER